MLTWSHDYLLYYVGTRSGTVHVVHVKGVKHGGVGGGKENGSGGEGDTTKGGSLSLELGKKTLSKLYSSVLM